MQHASVTSGVFTMMFGSLKTLNEIHGLDLPSKTNLHFGEKCVRYVLTHKRWLREP